MEIFEVEPEKEWTYKKTPYISGKIISQRIDIPALELELLPVHCIDKRKQEFKLEQVILGTQNYEMDDPITDEVELKNMGRMDEAWDLLYHVIKQDLRCIDAHVHMGHFKFGDGLSAYWVKQSLKHFTMGAELGHYFLGYSFDGKLPWSAIDNRPYLRALHGQCLCYWALGNYKAAADIAHSLLKLNKSDNQGIRFILPEIEAGIPYRESNE